MKLKFSKNFYSLEAAQNSVKAYRKLADFEIKEKKDFIEITIKNIDKDFKHILADEFSNYFLAETENVLQSKEN